MKLRNYLFMGMTVLICAGPATALTDAQKCEAAKLKIAGKYSFCRFKAEAKAVKTGAPADFSSCDSKFGLKWNVAETNSGGRCPTTGDVAVIQEQVITSGESISTTLSGTRFVDNSDGTTSDLQTGLMWEQKTDFGPSLIQCNQPTCPAGYQFLGTYTTTAGTNNGFTMLAAADEHGAANDPRDAMHVGPVHRSDLRPDEIRPPLDGHLGFRRFLLCRMGRLCGR